MRKTLLTAAFGALLTAMPASAADFTPPEGCEAFLTVQSRECAASLLWRCDVAPGGHWEAVFGIDGLESITSYSDNYQWLDAVYLWDSSREEFVPPAEDAIDLDVLTETGADTFDFIMRRSDSDGVGDMRFVGSDALTGKTTEIDGFALDIVATEIKVIAEDGALEYEATGTQYLSRDLGLFFLGPDTVTYGDGSTYAYDGSPIDIIRPGEPGFGATTPFYDCNQQDASWRLELPEGYSHAG